MSGLVLTITDAGRAALVNAANNGTAPVVMATVGVSATALTPTPDMTALPDEVKRISTISGDAVANDTIHVTIRDESADTYTVRSIALYLSDGTLFALYGQAEPVMEKSAQAMLLLSIDVVFAEITADQISFGDTNFLNPPATTERQGVVELATTEETTGGVDTLRAVTPKGLRAAITSWLDSRFGSGAPSSFVKSLLTSSSASAFRSLLEIKSAALKNEGAGNGLDADLLDGQHGSYYTNIAARLGYTPWGPNNDGPGSGLDADTVDGFHASDFARLSGASFTGNISTTGNVNLSYNGHTNVLGLSLSETSLAFYNTITGTNSYEIFRWLGSGGAKKMALTEGGHLAVLGNTVWHAGNDGPGSGLDADTLDGFGEDWFLRYRGAISTYDATSSRPSGFYRLDEPGFSRLFMDLQVTDGSSTPRVQMAFSYGNNILLRTFQDHVLNPNPWVTLWTSGNDGSGSGLDADLLDGLQSSDYAKLSDYAASKAINGYCRLPNGIIIQWGTVTVSADAYANLAFPISFPTACRSIVSSVATEVGNPNAQANGPLPYGVTQYGASFYNAAPTATAWWMAIGD